MKLFEELGINKNIKIRVVPWHNRFDVLIGSQDLQKLQANINYKHKILQLGEIKIPFYLEYNNNQINIKNVNSNIIHVPTSIEDGEVYIPEQKFENFIIPECFAKTQKGIAKIPVYNPTKIEINFQERINVIPCEYFQNEAPNKESENIKFSEKFRLPHLNKEEREKLINLCYKFAHCFYSEDCDLSFTNQVKHSIRTVNNDPIFTKSFRHPHNMQEEIQRQITKLLQDNIIRPSISPYSSPVWIVPKKTDASQKKKYRMVIDYRRLNENTIEDKYPLPKIEEILDNLGKCTYFTTLDLAQGFHQIEMHPDSIEKTAFTVNNGHYEYLRMPFGLKNAPATFQRMMDNVLREYQYKTCFVYMDDIVIFSKSLQDHLIHLEQIFKKLKETNLKVQLDKSEFLRKEVNFLGHVITPDGITPNPIKIQAIQKYPIPKTVKEIKSYLGLVGYYRKFIPNFARLTQPMTKCLRKNEKINISDPSYQEAFEVTKEAICNAPVLIYPDFSKPFTLTTDASTVAIGSVLSQSDRPVAFYSRTLNSAEKNYSPIELELLSILASTRHFRPYLFGKPFTVETDHNPLVWLSKIKEPNSRLIRWRLKLEEFDFVIKYKKGKENHVADALSRIEINFNENESIIPQCETNPDPNELDEILKDLLHNTSLSHINDKDLDELIETRHSINNDDNGLVIPITEHPVNHFKNQLIILLDKDAKEVSTTRDYLFDKTKVRLTIKIPAENIENSMSDICKNRMNPNTTTCLFIPDEKLKEVTLNLFKQYLNNSVKLLISYIKLTDVQTLDAQKELIIKYHDETHNGINETYKQLKQKYYFPKLQELITSVINKCDICLQAKYERKPYKPQFKGPTISSKPFDTIYIDTFQYRTSKFLTIIDSFSKYAQAYLIKTNTAPEILNKLRHFIAHHDRPKRIVCDQGSEFKNKTFEEYLNMLGIELHYTTAYNPNSNSFIERFHSTILEKLRIINIKNPNEKPGNQMITAVWIYNQSIHNATGYSPFSILYGPYEHELSFSMTEDLYENYNLKRRNELRPFLEHIQNRMLAKEQHILNKLNEKREKSIDLTEENDIYIENPERKSKHKPVFQKATLIGQDENTIAIYNQNNLSNRNISKVKRIRNKTSFQIGHELNPSTAGQTDRNRRRILSRTSGDSKDA